MNNVFDNSELKAFADAIPSAVFIMDDEARILGLNAQAQRYVGADAEIVLHRLCGDALHCLNAARGEEICGQTDACPDCEIRLALVALSEGQRVDRRKHTMKLKKDGNYLDVLMLITAVPFEHGGRTLGLVILEDITELLMLQGLVPICYSCKKVRNDSSFWEQVESFIARHLKVDFTHGLCPDCYEKLERAADEEESVS